MATMTRVFIPMHCMIGVGSVPRMRIMLDGMCAMRAAMQRDLWAGIPCSGCTVLILTVHGGVTSLLGGMCHPVVIVLRGRSMFGVRHNPLLVCFTDPYIHRVSQASAL
jgi:hypothetical protein